MLTAPQFLYAIAKDVNENKLKFVNGKCRICGGKLFYHQNLSPCHYRDMTWLQEGLTRARDSDLVCPACRYLYGNSNLVVKPEFGDPGKPLAGLLRFDRRKAVNKEKPIALAAIIASKNRGFQTFNKYEWAEFGKNLFNPPEPPFVALATEDKRGIQYGPWQSIIAMSKEMFPVYFSYNVEVSRGSTVVNSTLVWVRPTAFKKAVELVKKCLENGARIPDTPDWVLALKCATEINKIKEVFKNANN